MCFIIIIIIDSNYIDVLIPWFLDEKETKVIHQISVWYVALCDVQGQQ